MTNDKKTRISKNLVAFMRSEEALTDEAATFIRHWILTDKKGKLKADYDIWDMVLKRYLPESRPVLFRSTARKVDGKIASFTGTLRCAEKFSGGKGFLIICDTKEFLQFSDMESPGNYSRSFFPIAELLRKEAKNTPCKFSSKLLEEYTKEDEYIMRVNLNRMCVCKWQSI